MNNEHLCDHTLFMRSILVRLVSWRGTLDFVCSKRRLVEGPVFRFSFRAEFSVRLVVLGI